MTTPPSPQPPQLTTASAVSFPLHSSYKLLVDTVLPLAMVFIIVLNVFGLMRDALVCVAYKVHAHSGKALEVAENPVFDAVAAGLVILLAALSGSIRIVGLILLAAALLAAELLTR